MEPDTNAEKRAEGLEEFYKTKSKIQEDFNRIQLEVKVETLERKLDRYRKCWPQKDEEIKQITAEKQELLEDFELLLECINNHVCPVKVMNPLNPKGESHKLINLRLKFSKNERRHETEMSRITEELQNEQANCKKQQKEYEKQLAAVRRAAAQEKAELQQSHEQEFETVRSETRAAQREIERVTRDCDETVNILKKEFKDVETKYEKQVQEVRKQCEDSEPEIARLYVKVMKLNDIISEKDDMIESLQNKLQEKEDIIEKEAARFSELKKRNKTLKQAADREQETRDLLEGKVQENNESKATIEKLDAELKTENAKNNKLEEENQELLLLRGCLNYEIDSLNETLKHQKWKYRKLEERLHLPKMEAQRYKQELFNCTEAFQKAFPHAAHNQDPAFRDFRTKFLTIKKKHFQGATSTTLSQSEKEEDEKLTEILQERLKKSEQRTEELLKEVEKQKRKNDADYRKHAVSLSEAQTRISEWGNSLLKAERDQKQEIGHLRSRVMELQVELKKERRRQAETPRKSAPQPETAVPKTGPGPPRILPPITRPPS